MATNDIEIVNGPEKNLASDDVVAYADITSKERKAGAEVNPLNVTLLDISELTSLLHEVDAEWKRSVERDKFDEARFNKLAKKLIDVMLNYVVTTEEFRKELRPYMRIKNNISRLMLQQVYQGESRYSSAQNEILGIKSKIYEAMKWLNKKYKLNSLNELDLQIETLRNTDIKGKARAKALQSALDLEQKRDEISKLKDQLEHESQEIAPSGDFEDINYIDTLADYESKLAEVFEELSDKAKEAVKRADPLPTPLRPDEVRRLREYGIRIDELESNLEKIKALDKPGIEGDIARAEDYVRQLRREQNRILGPHIRAARPKPYKFIVFSPNLVRRTLNSVALLVSYVNQKSKEEIDEMFGELTSGSIDEEGNVKSGMSLSSLITSSRSQELWGSNSALGPNRRYLSGSQSYNAENYEKKAGAVRALNLLQAKVRLLIAKLRDKLWGVGRWTSMFAANEGFGGNIEDALQATGKLNPGESVFNDAEVGDKEMAVFAKRSYEKRMSLLHKRSEAAHSAMRVAGLEGGDKKDVNRLIQQARDHYAANKTLRSYTRKRQIAIRLAKSERGDELDDLKRELGELQKEKKIVKRELSTLELAADPTIAKGTGGNLEEAIKAKKAEKDAIQTRQDEIKAQADTIYKYYMHNPVKESNKVIPEEENIRLEYEEFRHEVGILKKIETDLNGLSTKFEQNIKFTKDQIEGLFTGNLPGRIQIGGLPGGIRTLIPSAAKTFAPSKFATVTGINSEFGAKFLTAEEQNDRIAKTGKRIAYYTLKSIIGNLIQKVYGLSPVRSQGMVQGPGVGYTGPKGRVHTTPERKALPGQSFRRKERIEKRAEALRQQRRSRKAAGEEIGADDEPPMEIEHILKCGDLVVLENVNDAPYLNGLRGYVRKVSDKYGSAIVDLFKNDVVLDDSILVNFGEARWYIRD